MIQEGIVLSVKKDSNGKLRTFDVTDKEVSDAVGYDTKKRAFSNNNALLRLNGKWKQIPLTEFEKHVSKLYETADVDKEQMGILNFLKKSIDLKPDLLKMPDLKWKFLVRTALRGKNIMVTGPSGSGKTLAVKSIAMAFPDREFYVFNMGGTQDPRATLIGNAQFDPKKGTYFSESLFVKAIQTENSIILLDELSRMHPEASNILMTVLDESQRYLRLDESSNQATIKVAKGVTFIATANIGNEYTTTRVLDRALVDRFTIIEMDTLNKDTEFELLKMLYPSVSYTDLTAVAEIVDTVRNELKSDAPRVTSFISTRASVEVASLLYDGFSLNEAAEVAIFPLFSEDGGIDSERTYIKQVLQKFVTDGETLDDEDLFNADDIES
jgi:nitric oxide reductase NorQ protein